MKKIKIMKLRRISTIQIAKATEKEPACQLYTKTTKTPSLSLADSTTNFIT